MKEDRKGFVDYLSILVQWRKTFIINFFTVCFITAALSLVVPKWYKSSTTVLPPVDDSGGLGLSSFLSKMPIGAMSMALTGISAEAYEFMAIINSRTIMEDVASEFGLMKVYDKENMEETVKELRSHVGADINENGTITVFVEAATPWFAFSKTQDNEARKLATDMANYFIQKLDKMNRALKIEKAKNTRLFIEKRYQQNLDDLFNAEENFKLYQQKYGTIALPEQTAATISAAAELQAEVIAKEVELKVMSDYAGKSNLQYRRTHNELKQLNAKLSELKAAKDQQALGQEIFIPLDNLPELGVEYLRLYREVKLQETLLEFLLPQYEQAKIQEARDTPTIQVLDGAVHPVLRARPKRGILVVLMGLVSIGLSFLYVVSVENIRSLKISDPAKYDALENMWETLKGDLKFSRKEKNRH